MGQTYQGYGDIAYHFLIGKDGAVYEARPLEYRGAHVFGHNDHNIGIAFLGDYSSNPLSKEQVTSAVKLSEGLNNRFGESHGGIAQPLPIFTHGEFDPKKHEELTGAKYQIQFIKHVTSTEWGFN
ncbi:MAG: hypothetical protein NVS3B3_24240 [Aquirhabdus sp.]